MRAGICSVTYGFHGAPHGPLNDPGLVHAALVEAAASAGLTAVASTHHAFEPQGLSAVVLLSESHIAAHTWPETGRAYVTLTSCKAMSRQAIDALGEQLAARLGASGVESRAVSLTGGGPP